MYKIRLGESFKPENVNILITFDDDDDDNEDLLWEEYI